MKKTLIALAAATVASTGALAAQVEIAGIVDAGLAYKNVDTLKGGTNETFTLDSGNHSGSRFIFKGSEELSAGYTASFYLESGFDADTGSLNQNGRLFGRESRLSLETPYGTISMGRQGALTAGVGTCLLYTSDAADEL